jgi:hypothetical protein
VRLASLLYCAISNDRMLQYQICQQLCVNFDDSNDDAGLTSNAT